MAGSPSDNVIQALKDNKAKLDENIKKIQSLGVPNPADFIISILEKQGLILSYRQIAKKMLLIRTKSCSKPMSEEDAQLYIYGKVYYENGVLFDKDKNDPNSPCIAKPGDEDYQPPIDIKNHPLIQNIEKLIKDFKDGVKQFGVKLGEFLIAIPAAIAVIITSITALAAAVLILPPGAGLPTALTAVQTMIAAIKDLQAKIAAFLPYLDPIVDAIGLLLDKAGQVVIGGINTVFGVATKITGLISGIVGSLTAVTGIFNAKKKESEEQKPAVETKANKNSVVYGDSVNLEATASGGDWKFSYQWTDSNGTVISSAAKATVTPTQSTTYTCKATDGTGTASQSSINITVTETPK